MIFKHLVKPIHKLKIYRLLFSSSITTALSALTLIIGASKPVQAQTETFFFSADLDGAIFDGFFVGKDKDDNGLISTNEISSFSSSTSLDPKINWATDDLEFLEFSLATTTIRDLAAINTTGDRYNLFFNSGPPSEYLWDYDVNGMANSGILPREDLLVRSVPIEQQLYGVTCCDNSTLYVLDATNGKEIRTISLSGYSSEGKEEGGGFTGLATDPTTDSLYSLNWFFLDGDRTNPTFANPDLYSIDPDTGEVLLIEEFLTPNEGDPGDNFVTLAFDKDGLAYTVTDDAFMDISDEAVPNQLYSLNVEDGSLTYLLDLRDLGITNEINLAYNFDDEYLYYLNRGDDGPQLTSIDLDNLEVVNTVPLIIEPPLDPEYSPLEPPLDPFDPDAFFELQGIMYGAFTWDANTGKFLLSTNSFPGQYQGFDNVEFFYTIDTEGYGTLERGEVLSRLPLVGLTPVAAVPESSSPLIIIILGTVGAVVSLVGKNRTKS